MTQRSAAVPGQSQVDGDCAQADSAAARGLRSATPSRVSQAVAHLKALCDFAYEQGFHELGYDPLAELVRELAVQSESAPKGPYPGYRAQVLEEAATVCEETSYDKAWHAGSSVIDDAAKRIRALKNAP